jgi:hypothetical protein
VPVEDRKGSASAGAGFDLVENVFNLIFGGCCRPQYATATATTTTTPDSSKRKEFVSTMNDHAAKEETKRSRRSRPGHPIQEIPQPPEIRRLALAEELQSLQLERSGSLSFLVYQDDVSG